MTVQPLEGHEPRDTPPEELDRLGENDVNVRFALENLVDLGLRLLGPQEQLGLFELLLRVGQAFEQIGGLCRGIVPGEVRLDCGGSGPKTWVTEDG